MLCKQPVKPRRLRPGSTIGVIAPASPGDPALADAGIARLEEQGFRVVRGEAAGQTWGYLAGSDKARAADINAMFADPAIDAILCLRGGYGTMRLLDLVDYETIAAHPKIFAGYSDITALHLAIGSRTGLVTFHGPMAASDLGREMPASTWDAFIKTVAKSAPAGVVANPPEMPPAEFLVGGTAAGPLIGGNLSLISATMGTSYEIDTTGKILFLEEVGEAPYRIDRMLTQLLLAGKLQAAAGIVFAECSDCVDEEKPGFTLEEVLLDRLGGLGKPLLYHLYFGHTAEKVTLPLGIDARLSSADTELRIIEAAVTE